MRPIILMQNARPFEGFLCVLHDAYVIKTGALDFNRNLHGIECALA